MHKAGRSKENHPFTAAVNAKVAPSWPSAISEIMDSNPVTVAPDTTVEDVVAALREHSCPGCRWWTPTGSWSGIVTEADLVLPDDQGDLHIPHYVNLFGGTVFLESLSHFEGACARRSPRRPRT